MIINLQTSLMMIINSKISGKSMILYEINKKLAVARQNAFVFN